MNHLKLIYLGLIIILLSCKTTKENKEQLTPPKNKNVLFIMVDDLRPELNIYGQNKIISPHIDALAKNGMKFTQHYSGAPVCAPARYVFLTGKHAGHALSLIHI